MSKKSTKLEALHVLFEEHNIQTDLIEGNSALIEAVKKNAEIIQDYRNQSYIRHPLVSIVMLVFFAVLANANEWAEIETFAKRRKNGCGSFWISLMMSRQTTYIVLLWATLIRGISSASR